VHGKGGGATHVQSGESRNHDSATRRLHRSRAVFDGEHKAEYGVRSFIRLPVYGDQGASDGTEIRSRCASLRSRLQLRLLNVASLLHRATIHLPRACSASRNGRSYDAGDLGVDRKTELRPPRHAADSTPFALAAPSCVFGTRTVAARARTPTLPVRTVRTDAY